MSQLWNTYDRLSTDQSTHTGAAYLFDYLHLSKLSISLLLGLLSTKLSKISINITRKHIIKAVV